MPAWLFLDLLWRLLRQESLLLFEMFEQNPNPVVLNLFWLPLSATIFKEPTTFPAVHDLLDKDF